MIWGYPHFRKPLYLHVLRRINSTDHPSSLATQNTGPRASWPSLFRTLSYGARISAKNEGNDTVQRLVAISARKRMLTCAS